MDFVGQRILCLGDVMLDRFYYGRVDRISPEAPVPVVRMTEHRAMLGGAGNVARNIASLGGQAVLLGIVGEDLAGRELSALIEGAPGLIDANIRSATRPTICKTRIIATHQQLVRLDEEVTGAISEADVAAVCRRLSERLPGCQALVISDYAKGLLRAEVVRYAIQVAHRSGIPVFVDPKRDDFAFYSGATVLTPNLKELAAAARAPVETDEQVAAAAQALLTSAQAKAMLVTRSEKGMLLTELDGSVHVVPTHAKEVFDVSGAGDTVIAVAALSVAAGHPLPRAMRIANAAAGVVVGKLGTATLDIEELNAALDADAATVADIAGKVVSPGRAVAIIEGWRRRGLEVGFTNGCFDILHRGHVTMLTASRAACDRLVVALNSDASVRRLKGLSRPINTLDDRSAVIAALQSVDLVVSFDDDTPLEIITRLQPDVLFKGADYRVEDVVGAEVVRACGGRVALIDLVPGRSTSNIIARSQGTASGLS
ncbi:bifunctional D-glycero-beta-D-manno-heptose-7-phosphate kinase/D-glycero-beta-D-manno-heptose 1-phosphate adenylyltransferase HldE [Roseomonas chloroacetimidivorans]|uniref:bifunctional D-glycero-beta-D-manno-heptose-7-phosphate kinase/D-glycero-beta-D-manno-heptose 1-phosphate adenylyltransferase HldE n=1 Tax=Roseomonas chloroacetimidivorans TaxID=1766656 RepID=UPI003C7856C1